MNDLQIFNYSGNEVRTVQQDGEPWFVLKDVCQVLGISHVKDTADRLEQDEVGQTEVIDSLGRRQTATIINESGLYHVILRSDKPEAKPFRKWVTSEVLPTIRKTGGYVNDDTAFLNTYLPNADDATKSMFLSTLQTVRSLNAKIEADKPKVLFADSVSTADTSILIGELAKLIKQNGVDIGQNRLFQFLRENGHLIKRLGADYNMPTQYSMDRKLFEIKERTHRLPDGCVKIIKTVKVTGKGQLFFMSLFLGR